MDLGEIGAQKSVVEEDSFIYQQGDRRKVFYGDIYWRGLYNPFFDVMNAPDESFRVLDLDFVDEIIMDHVFDELSMPESDIVILHFLGIDHAGHSYHTNHPKMH